MRRIIAMMAPDADVIVVGAGPAGSSTAFFLAQSGLRVLLLDRAEFPRDKTCGDGLSPRALRVLGLMGARPEIEAVGHRIDSLRIFSPNGDSVSAPILSRDEQPTHAMVLPRLKLDDFIRQAAVRGGAEFRHGAVTDLTQVDGRYTGVVQEGRPLTARVVVLATGAFIGLFERAGLNRAGGDLGRAARAYFEGLPTLPHEVEFHFDSVPLPGYGWIFPTSSHSANIGAGYFVKAGQRPPQASPQQTMRDFLRNPYVARVVGDAEPSTTPKGYPLRTDFLTAPLAVPGLVMVGEAAGLVNPLTGEGIDFALESGELAAELIAAELRADRSAADLAEAIIRGLRGHFGPVFTSIGRVRDLYFQPWVLNRFVRAAARHEDLKLLLIQIALGNTDPARALRPGPLARLIFA